MKSSRCWKMNFSAEDSPRKSQSTRSSYLCRKNRKRKVSSKRTTNTFLRNLMTTKKRKPIAVSWVCWVYWPKELSGYRIGQTNLPGGKVRSWRSLADSKKFLKILMPSFQMKRTNFLFDFLYFLSTIIDQLIILSHHPMIIIFCRTEYHQPEGHCQHLLSFPWVFPEGRWDQVHHFVVWKGHRKEQVLVSHFLFIEHWWDPRPGQRDHISVWGHSELLYVLWWVLPSPSWSSCCFRMIGHMDWWVHRDCYFILTAWAHH